MVAAAEQRYAVGTLARAPLEDADDVRVYVVAAPGRPAVELVQHLLFVGPRRELDLSQLAARLRDDLFEDVEVTSGDACGGAPPEQVRAVLQLELDARVLLHRAEGQVELR